MGKRKSKTKTAKKEESVNYDKFGNPMELDEYGQHVVRDDNGEIVVFDDDNPVGGEDWDYAEWLSDNLSKVEQLIDEVANKLS